MRVEGSEVAQEGVVKGDLAVGEAGGQVGFCDVGGGGVVEDGLGADESWGKRPGIRRRRDGAEEEVDEEWAVEGCSVDSEQLGQRMGSSSEW